jgi:hypothetical protein
MCVDACVSNAPMSENLRYGSCIMEFLVEPPENLDGGYAVEFQEEALSEGSLADAVDFVLSDGKQKELRGIFKNTPPNGFDVERKNKQDKQGETIKMTTLARVSRNSILQRYRLQRRAYVDRVIENCKRKRKDRFMSWQALAHKRRPDLYSRPRGKLVHERLSHISRVYNSIRVLEPLGH